jgi:hypothetical protein
MQRPLIFTLKEPAVPGRARYPVRTAAYRDNSRPALP